MAIILQNFDGGTNGAAITTANTAANGDTAPTAVDTGMTFSSAQKKTGTLSAVPPVTTAVAQARWQLATTSTTLAVRFYQYITAAHTADYFLYDVRGNTGAANADRIARLVINGSNKFVLRDYGSGAGVDIWTATTAIPLNTWVRVEVLIEQGASSTTSRARIAYYLNDSTTATEDSGWITGLNMLGGGAAVQQIYLGKGSGSAYGGTLYLDAIEARTGTDYSAAFIGPYQVPLPVPTGFTVTATDGVVQIVTSWTAVSGAASYEVQVESKNVGTGVYTLLGTYPTTATSKTLTTELAGGTTYHARVRALP